MRVYMDVCCLNRPFDSQIQDRVKWESEAVLMILKRCQKGFVSWIASEVVEEEISKTPSQFRKQNLLNILKGVHERVVLNSGIIRFAEHLTNSGFGSYDALHLSCAKYAKVDYFLTTDDDIIKRAFSHEKEFAFEVINPVDFIRKEIFDEKPSYH